MTDILAEERRRKILDQLEAEGTVKTSQLASLFSVSEVTIRRDLEVLKEEGKLKKVHGGAVANEKDFESSYQGDTITFEPSFQQKSEIHREEKEEIGEKAASMVKDGSSIFLETGTTTMQIVDHLDAKQGLSVLTNSLNHGLKLSKINGLEVLLTGGRLRANTSALVGPIARRSLEEIYVDTLFMGINGITIDQGYTVPTVQEAEMSREVTGIANEVVIVADSSKFGKVSHAKVAEIDGAHAVITDDKVDDSYREAFADIGVELIIA